MNLWESFSLGKWLFTLRKDVWVRSLKYFLLLTTICILNVRNDFQTEMVLLTVISISKWFPENDYCAQEMIFGLVSCQKNHFYYQKNDFLPCWKWFWKFENDSSSPPKSFLGKWFLKFLLWRILHRIYSWWKKNISTGNYYFRKWLEIIFSTEIPHSLQNTFTNYRGCVL